VSREALRLAAQALDDGRRADALDALLDAWRETPEVELAELIDRLSAEIDRALPPVAAKTQKALHEAWIDVEAGGRAVDFPRLAAAIERGNGPMIRERFDRLFQRPRDPRMSALALRLCASCVATRSVAFPMWTQIFKVLTDGRDVRARAGLEGAARARRVGSPTFMEMFHRREKEVAQAMAAWPEVTLDAATLEGVAELGARIDALALGPAADPAELLAPRAPAEVKTADAHDLVALFAMVYESPDDDARRAVLADALEEAGDPRGELIHLQLRGPLPPKLVRQVNKLVREHGKAWLGPLEPYVEARGRVFGRGFLEECTLRIRTKQARARAESLPDWATVRKVRGVTDASILHAPSFRHVHAATLESSHELARLSGHDTPLLIRALHVRDASPVAPEDREPIASGRGLPALVDLTVSPFRRGGLELPGIVRAEDWAWILETPLGGRLERFSIVDDPIYARGIDVADFARAARARFDASGAAPTIASHLSHWSHRIDVRDGAPHVAVTPRSEATAWLPSLMESLENVRQGDVASVTVERSALVRPEDQARLVERLRGVCDLVFA
jgi:uncharacterized protein (TIGR02996 family)